MAWLGKFNVSDFAGAVTKLSESVKNIEKNFDSALGFESIEARDGRPAGERAASVFESFLAKATSESILGKPASESTPSLAESNAQPEASQIPAAVLEANVQAVDESASSSVPGSSGSRDEGSVSAESAADARDAPTQVQNPLPQQDSVVSTLQSTSTETLAEPAASQEEISSVDVRENGTESRGEEQQSTVSGTTCEEERVENMDTEGSSDQSAKEARSTPTHVEVNSNGDHVNGVLKLHHEVQKKETAEGDVGVQLQDPSVTDSGASTPAIVEMVNGMHIEDANAMHPTEGVEWKSSPVDGAGKGGDRVQKELRMMEAALQGAARQAQSKADEISRLMVENEQLKSSLEELKRKPNEADLDNLREEYQQRIGAAERKVYALTKERDMLRREQNRKSDSSLLLKEKDEIIKAVMAEGEELSKKQAAQEGTIKKLRAQVREMEEEKNRLLSKLQVEETKVESMRKDKAATEKALQEAVERGQTELAAQKEFYSTALNEAKEAAALAEARVDSEARADLDRRLREASERESTLVQNIDELRQALTRTEQQAAFREDMLRNDIEDLEKRCQAAEARYEELSARMPDSTRPLLRHIEALQESMTMRTEAWNGVERSLNSRLQQAEAKTASAQERERAVTERLTQTLSRMAVMEAQVSCLRAEQAQLQRSLEKERQRASENRQEYLTTMEAAATHEGRARQLEEEIKTIRKQYKRELNEEKARREALEQEIDQERAAMADYEKRIRAEGRAASEKAVAAAQQNDLTTAKSLKRWPSMSSQGSMEENFLQSSLETMPDRVMGHSDRHSDRFSFSDRPPSPSPHFGKNTYEHLETHLRQKEGEVASYAARLTALESTRDSLAEELVKATTQCEALRAEATLLPGMRAELESLRRRHTSALELMGERDEEVEELRADLSDVKQMYREQIDMLVGQIERLSAAVGSK